MKHFFYISLFTLLIAGCSNTPDEKQTDNKERDNFKGISENFDTNWAFNKHWDDGKAEVAVYAATRTIYNKPRNFDYTYITVSEDFNKEFNTKTDDYNRKDLYKVMKVNAFAMIPTDNYPYHFLTSIFINRENPLEVNKMTNGSQEWCGNTFKEYSLAVNDIKLKYHSYWDGEGDGEKTLPNNILFEDQLTYSLRSLKFKDGLAFDAKVLESQITSKVGKLLVYDAKFMIRDTVGFNQQPAWKVSVALESDKINTYYFTKNYPQTLLQRTTWDGRNMQLKKLSRYAYWKN